MADDGEIARMQNGVRSFVSRGVGKSVQSIRDTPPQVVLSLLCASALAPLATIDPGLSGAAVVASSTVLSSIGAGTLSGLLASAIDRARSKEPETAKVEARVEDIIHDALNDDDTQGVKLRVEIAAMLKKIDAGSVALRAAIDSGNGEVYTAIVAVVSSGFSEMGFLVADVQQTADKIRASLDDQGVNIRRIMDQNIQEAFDIRMLLERVDSIGRVGGRAAAGTSNRLDMEALTECPYLGLFPFAEENENVFYGRERTCVDLAVRVAAQVTSGGLIVVTGASGAGKSSILRAGLMPILARGTQVAGSEKWHRFVITPTSDSLTELATVLTALSGGDIKTLRDSLERNPSGAYLEAQRALMAFAARRGTGTSPHEANDMRLVLIVDQFERIFTAMPEAAGESARLAFIRALCAMASTSAEPGARSIATVVIAVRGDFWDHCAAYPELAIEMQRGQYVVRPMDDVDLRLAIIGPAYAAGATIEPGLIEAILADLRVLGGEDAIGVLPLLSQAMMLTWQNRDDSDQLTSHGYALTGGVGQAVQKTADSVYRTLSPPQQLVAQRMMRAMAVVSAGGRLASRPVSRSDLYIGQADRRDVDTVSERLAANRLIVLDSHSVQVAHEALIERWPLLRQWIDEDRQFQEWRYRTQLYAQAWRESRNDKDTLLRGIVLASAMRWCEARPEEIESSIILFVIRSQIEWGPYPVKSVAGERALEATLDLTDIRLRNQLLDAAIKAYSSDLDLRKAGHYLGIRRSGSTPGEGESPRWRTALPLLLRYGALGSIFDATGSSIARKVGDLEPVFSAIGSALVSIVIVSSLAAAWIGAWIGFVLLITNPPPDYMNYRIGSAGIYFWLAGCIVCVPFVYRLNILFRDNPAVLHFDAHGSGPRVIPALRRIWNMTWVLPTLLLANASVVYIAADGDVGISALHLAALAVAGVGLELLVLFRRSRRDPELLKDPGPSRPRGPLVIGAALAPALLISYYVYLVPAPRNVLTNANGFDVADVAFSPNGSTIAAFGINPNTKLDTSKIYLWNASSQQQVSVLSDNSSSSYPGGLAFSPDGESLAVGDINLYLWNIATRHSTEIDEPQGSFINAVAEGQDGKIIAEANANGDIHLWSVDARRWIGEFVDPFAVISNKSTTLSAEINQIAISPDGTLLAASDTGGHVYVWNLSGGSPISTFTGASGDSGDIVFSPDGSALAIAGKGTKLWNVKTHKVTAVLLGPDTSPQVLAFSPNGKTLAIGDYNETIYLWNAVTRKIAREIDSPIVLLGGLAISPNGKTLAVCGENFSDDNKIFLYTISLRAGLRIALPSRSRCSTLAPASRRNWWDRGSSAANCSRGSRGGRGVRPCHPTRSE